MIASDTSLGWSCIILCYRYHKGGSIYLGRRCWLDYWANYYLIHIITTCQTNNSGGLRIESIWFLNRACWRRIHELSRNQNQNKIELAYYLEGRRPPFTYYYFVDLWVSAGARLRDVLPWSRAGLLTGSYLAERISPTIGCWLLRLLPTWPEVNTDVQDMWEEILRYLYINSRLLSMPFFPHLQTNR